MKARDINKNILTEVGKIVHQARSGRVIVKLYEEKKINSGDIILDEEGNTIGKINELIGSVHTPYASIIPVTQFKRNSGEKIFKLSISKKIGNSSRKSKKFNNQAKIRKGI